MSRKLKIEKGTVYGLLTVIGEGKPKYIPSGVLNRTISCQCECGTIKDVWLCHLVHGKIISCGCLKGESHGDSYNTLYRKWQSMKYRCTETAASKKDYFDRGISVCQEWKIYDTFKKWALKNGYKKGLTIERIDNDKGYFPENCKFVPYLENTNNRTVSVRVNYNGEQIALPLLLRKLGLWDSYSAIYQRIKRYKWDLERALYTPVKLGGNYEFTNKACNKYSKHLNL